MIGSQQISVHKFINNRMNSNRILFKDQTLVVAICATGHEIASLFYIFIITKFRDFKFWMEIGKYVSGRLDIRRMSLCIITRNASHLMIKARGNSTGADKVLLKQKAAAEIFHFHVLSTFFFHKRLWVGQLKIIIGTRPAILLIRNDVYCVYIISLSDGVIFHSNSPSR